MNIAHTTQSLTNIMDVKKLESLSEEEVLAMRQQFEEAIDSVQHRMNVEAFLKIENILEERGMTTEDLVEIQDEILRLRNQKYSDGKGNLWSGRGKRPAWVIDLVGKDGDVEHLAWKDESIQPLSEKKKRNVDSEKPTD